MSWGERVGSQLGDWVGASVVVNEEWTDGLVVPDLEMLIKEG